MAKSRYFSVKLRDGQFVNVAMCQPACGFTLFGRTADAQPQLWFGCGHFLDTHQDHPLDIVAQVRGNQLEPVGHNV